MRRIGVRLLGVCAGAAFVAGCQTPWDAPAPGARTPPPTPAAVAARAPATPTTPPDQAVHPAPAPVPPDAQPAPPAAPAAEEPIDLGVALRLAGVNNPTINLARERIREALAGQLGARALLLPSVTVGTNYHYHTGALQAGSGLIRDPNAQSLYLGFGAQAVGSQSVTIPGVRLFAHLGDAAYEPLAARQQVRARQSEAQAVQNEILLDVAAAYLELVGAEAQLTVTRRGRVELDAVVRETRAFAEAGQGRRADADRARTRADLLRREEFQAGEEVAVASARLCRLLGLDPSVRLRTPGETVDAFRLIPEDADPEALVETAVRARPEVFARSAAVAEAQVRTRQERVRPWLPLVSAGYSGGAFGGGGSLVANQFSPLKGRSDFDVVAVWTVQNLGFGNRARVRQTDAGYGEALAEYGAAVNQIRRQVIDAQAEAKAAARQVGAAKAALASAEEGFRLEQSRIREGFGRPLEAIDSFRQLLDSRRELVRALVAFDVAQFRLYVAVGSDPLATAPAP
jgi:outer membrane protein TolC